MKVFNQDCAIGSAYSSIEKIETNNGVYYKGRYISNEGNVCLIYSKKWKEYYSLSLYHYHNGRSYYRNIKRNKLFTERSMSIFAGKFIRELNEKIQR